ncbi:hypothetical protein [Paracoccus alkanivorans]|uniref:hypothetical protein n=1 Tax=Paracoccus alkanivorans TaxID=2116655 RepID=UPI001AA073A7|nr:hypothetical protein [Paracoccus alkanivorans]
MMMSDILNPRQMLEPFDGKYDKSCLRAPPNGGWRFVRNNQVCIRTIPPTRFKQTKRLRDQAEKGGLRFDAYLPPELALWLLDKIKQEQFLDPSEAVFVILGEHEKLEPYADLRQELFERSLQAAIDASRPPPLGGRRDRNAGANEAAPTRTGDMAPSAVRVADGIGLAGPPRDCQIKVGRTRHCLLAPIFAGPKPSRQGWLTGKYRLPFVLLWAS